MRTKAQQEVFVLVEAEGTMQEGGGGQTEQATTRHITTITNTHYILIKITSFIV